MRMDNSGAGGHPYIYVALARMEKSELLFACTCMCGWMCNGGRSICAAARVRVVFGCRVLETFFLRHADTLLHKNSLLH